MGVNGRERKRMETVPIHSAKSQLVNEAVKRILVEKGLL